MSIAAIATSSDITQLVAHEPVDTNLVNSMMDLFDGHRDLAMLWKQGRAPGFYRVNGLRRKIAFKAHLTGLSTVGVYPFKGVDSSCGCPQGQHVCDGGGCDYMCIDIDAHSGPQDADKRLRRIEAVADDHGVRTQSFTSRSGTGAHAYVYFDEPVPTNVASNAAKFLVNEAGANRCDIIPSANHFKGYGTLHALPMSPSFEAGGGLLLDRDLRAVTDVREAVERLRETHKARVGAGIIHQLARAAPVPKFKPPEKPVKRSKTTVKDIGRLIAYIAKIHPQFRAVISSLPKTWKGGRSGRDAMLAGILRRQPLPMDVCAQLLVDLEGTKAHERGLDYAYALLEAQDSIDLEEPPTLAGQKVKGRQEGPWYDRLAPPTQYGCESNPWWDESVQLKLKDPKVRSRGKDSIILAYLIDRFYRGTITRRQFYASHQNLSDALAIPKRTVGNSINRIAKRFKDILTVTPGIPHSVLRIATAFRVVTESHLDLLEW